MLQLKKYEGGSSLLNSQGTVRANAGKGGSVTLIRKNFENPDKRVAVLIKDVNGNSEIVACSSAVSQAFRDKKIDLHQLVNFEILQNEDGINFISMPASGAVQEFKIDDLNAEPTPVSASFLPEELVAF